MANVRKARRFNHKRITQKVEKIQINNLKLGTICQFNYGNINTTDKKPLILFLGHDKSGKLVHGLNLNYMSEYEVNYLFGRMNASATPGGELVKDTMETPGEGPKEIREVQYYRLSLGDVFGRTGDQKSPTKKLYDRYIKNFVSNRDVYRTYKVDNIRGNFQVMHWKFNQRQLERLGGNRETVAPKRTKHGTPEDPNRTLKTTPKTKMDNE